MKYLCSQQSRAFALFEPPIKRTYPTLPETASSCRMATTAKRRTAKIVAGKKKPATKRRAVPKKKAKPKRRAKVAPPKPNTGRPQYKKSEKDRRVIAKMIGAGDSEREVSRILGIARNTLRKHYEHELETAHLDTMSKVKQKILEGALAGNVTLLIWASKALLGWQEPPKEHRIGGSLGAPPIQQVTIASNIDTANPEANDPVELAAFYAQALEAAATVH